MLSIFNLRRETRLLKKSGFTLNEVGMGGGEVIGVGWESNYTNRTIFLNCYTNKTIYLLMNLVIRHYDIKE